MKLPTSGRARSRRGRRPFRRGSVTTSCGRFGWCSDAAVRWEYLARNPAKATGKNAKSDVVERVALEPSEVDRLAGELRSPLLRGDHRRRLVLPAAVRILALERADVDGNELRIRRTLDGRAGSRRAARRGEVLGTVPLPLRAREALAELPPRLDTGSCSRRRQSGTTTPATGDAGSSSGRRGRGVRGRHPLHAPTLGDLWALAAGVPTSDVARFAGTTVTMLETTYHDLLETSADAARQRLDAFAKRSGQEMATAGVTNRRLPPKNENPAPAGLSCDAPGRNRTATSGSAGQRSIP